MPAKHQCLEAVESEWESPAGSFCLRKAFSNAQSSRIVSPRRYACSDPCAVGVSKSALKKEEVTGIQTKHY